MNSTSTTDFVEENNGGSDSDTNPDDPPEYYQPISTVDYDDNDSDSDSDLDQTNADASDTHVLPNGYYVPESEDGMSLMHLNDDFEAKSSSEDEEEGRMREEPAIMRAVRDDENRRNAPMSQENAMRVMEAMRGVTFGGLAPDWVTQIPEDRWMDQLRRIRQPEHPTSTNVQH